MSLGISCTHYQPQLRTKKPAFNGGVYINTKKTPEKIIQKIVDEIIDTTTKCTSTKVGDFGDYYGIVFNKAKSAEKAFVKKIKKFTSAFKYNPKHTEDDFAKMVNDADNAAYRKLKKLNFVTSKKSSVEKDNGAIEILKRRTIEDLKRRNIEELKRRNIEKDNDAFRNSISKNIFITELAL